MDKLARPETPGVVLCDLDGVVWIGHQPIPGSVEAIARLRSVGWRVLFVTNASFRRRSDIENDLSEIGVPATGDVLTSAMAAARSVNPGEYVVICGGEGLFEEVSERGARAVYAHDLDPTDVELVDAVVVGLYRALTYEALAVVSSAVTRGARFIASNTDPVYPTPRGPVPGGGAIVAAVQAATGVEPLVAGKPHRPMADLVRAECGSIGPGEMWMVGDRDDTDGAFARLLGVRFGHVLSGTITDLVQCDARGSDLAGLVSQIVDGY